MRKLLSRLARYVPSPFAPSSSSSATRTPPPKPSSNSAPNIKSAPGPSAPTPPPETGRRAVRRASHPSAYFNHNRAHRLYREHRWHRSHRAQHLLRLPRVLQSASEAHAHSTSPSAESRRARSPNSGVPGVGTGALDPLRLVARSKFRLLRLRWEPTATTTAGPQTPRPASAPPLSYLNAFHRLRRTAENAHSASEPSTSSTNPTPATPTTRAKLNALAASPLDRIFDALHLAMDERHRPPTVTYAERSPSPEPTPLPAGHPFASSIAAGSRTLVPPSLPPRAASPSPSVLSQRSTRSNRSQRPPSPDHYIRDPHRLVAYVLPFPQPQLSADVPPPPLRFLIYTPPPPPLLQPPEGEKEKTTTKVQRKWQEEVRAAHESKDKVASWRGLKSRVTKGVNWAVHRTTTADLDFLTRIPSDGEKFRRAVKDSKDRKDDVHPKDSAAGLLPNPEGLAPPRSSRSSMDSHVSATDDEADTTGATVKLEEMVLIYPPSMEQSPEQIREEFVNSLLRTKSKAQRDAVIATGLLPVSAALDWALVFVGWVFGKFGCSCLRSQTDKQAVRSRSTQSGRPPPSAAPRSRVASRSASRPLCHQATPRARTLSGYPSSLPPASCHSKLTLAALAPRSMRSASRGRSICQARVRCWKRWAGTSRRTTRTGRTRRGSVTRSPRT